VAVVSEVIDYKGAIKWDSSKPDGTPRKLLDVSRLSALGWKPVTDLKKGIAQAYQDYLSRLTATGLKAGSRQ
jgi:GDP-L-fucose synthase